MDKEPKIIFVNDGIATNRAKLASITFTPAAIRAALLSVIDDGDTRYRPTKKSAALMKGSE